MNLSFAPIRRAIIDKAGRLETVWSRWFSDVQKVVDEIGGGQALNVYSDVSPKEWESRIRAVEQRIEAISPLRDWGERIREVERRIETLPSSKDLGRDIRELEAAVAAGAFDASARQSGLLGDGTAGRVLRIAWLTLADGTNANTLKVTLASEWNGDVIAETDNVAKDATTGSFALNAAGTALTINLGDVLGAFGVITSGIANNVYTAQLAQNSNNINVRIKAGATNQDLTVLADSDTYIISVIYVTSA